MARALWLVGLSFRVSWECFNTGWPDCGVGRDGGWMCCSRALSQGASCGLHLLSAAHGSAGGTYEGWMQESLVARSWMGMEVCCIV